MSYVSMKMTSRVSEYDCAISSMSNDSGCLLFEYFILCSPFIANLLIRISLSTNKTQFPCQASPFSLQKFLGYHVLGYNDSSPMSNLICITRRASSSDITFRNVLADIRAKSVVHPGHTPCSCACVTLRSLLWA